MSTFDFERRVHDNFFLPLYEKKGYMVIQDNVGSNSPVDVLLEKDGKTMLVDEKVVSKKWDGMIVELMQHVGDPKGSWLHHQKDGYLYAECKQGTETIERLHYVNHAKLCKAIYNQEFWKKHYLRPQVSLGGYGVTIFVCPVWKILVDNDIAQLIDIT